MNKTYTLVLEKLTEEAFRAERSKIVTEEYKRRCEADSKMSKTQIMNLMSLEIGLTAKAIRDIVGRAGMETALPNYKNCGAWLKNYKARKLTHEG